MNDRHLAKALSALPQAAPEQSAWPDIERRLQAPSASDQPRSSVREWLLAGIAAAMVGGLAAIIVSVQSGSATPDVAALPEVAAVTESGQLEALMMRSQELEQRLTEIRAGNLRPETVNELEGYLALVDLELAGDDDRVDLWQQRVALLDTLVDVNSRLASNPTYQL